jgi:amino-acid N-acetyltransferase
VEEAAAIHALIESYARERLLLPRTMEQIYEGLREFHVAVKDGRVTGCCALRLWGELAEVRSLAVARDHQRRGLGSRLIQACVQEGRDLHVREVFVLTFQPRVFERLGFERVDKDRFPQKIWTECVNCPHFPNCGEIALTLQLK